MTQTKSFSVFSNFKSEAHLKIEEKKIAKNSFTHFANIHGGRNAESIVATTTAILSCLSFFVFQTNSKRQKFPLHFLIPEFYSDYTQVTFLAN